MTPTPRSITGNEQAQVICMQARIPEEACAKLRIYRNGDGKDRNRLAKIVSIDSAQPHLVRNEPRL